MSGSDWVALASVVVSGFLGFSVPIVSARRERKVEQVRCMRDQSKQGYIAVILTANTLIDNFIRAAGQTTNEDWMKERALESIALFHKLEQEIASVQVFGGSETNRLASEIKTAAVDLGYYFADSNPHAEKYERRMHHMDVLVQQFITAVRRELMAGERAEIA